MRAEASPDSPEGQVKKVKLLLAKIGTSSNNAPRGRERKNY